MHRTSPSREFHRMFIAQRYGFVVEGIPADVATHGEFAAIVANDTLGHPVDTVLDVITATSFPYAIVGEQASSQSVRFLVAFQENS